MGLGIICSLHASVPRQDLAQQNCTSTSASPGSAAAVASSTFSFCCKGWRARSHELANTDGLGTRKERSALNRPKSELDFVASSSFLGPIPTIIVDGEFSPMLEGVPGGRCANNVTVFACGNHCLTVPVTSLNLVSRLAISAMKFTPSACVLSTTIGPGRHSYLLSPCATHLSPS